MKTPNYALLAVTDYWVVIRDLGPWEDHSSVTNNPEAVVYDLAHEFGADLGGRRLAYYDSDGNLDELVLENGWFRRFSHLDATHHNDLPIP